MSLGRGNGDCWDVSGVIPVCFSHPPTSFTRDSTWSSPAHLLAFIIIVNITISFISHQINFSHFEKPSLQLLLSAFRLEMFPELELLIELEFSKLHSIVAGPAYVRLSDEFSLDVPPTCDWSPLLKWHISHLSPGWRMEVQDHLDISTRTVTQSCTDWDWAYLGFTQQISKYFLNLNPESGNPFCRDCVYCDGMFPDWR